MTGKMKNDLDVLYAFTAMNVFSWLCVLYIYMILYIYNYIYTLLFKACKLMSPSCV